MKTHRSIFAALLLLTSACGGDPTPGTDTFHHDEDCRIPAIDVAADRPADLLAEDWLSYLSRRIACVSDARLNAILESSDTMFYNRHGMVPGYQDSFGDSVQLPIGMRPNSIFKVHIDLAVPGGHAQIFQDPSVFHFPFGRPIGSHEKHAGVINFWHAPRGEDGETLPVAHWTRRPSNWTNRVEWVFPIGTVLGELMFLIDTEGQWHPFEIRTRTRTREGWDNDVFRPFTTAERFAHKLSLKRQESAAWEESAEIDALIEHARDPGTLRPATLSASHFRGAFETVEGAEDPLPTLSDNTILTELLSDTSFQSAKGKVWKSHGDLVAYAPTVDAGMSIVPRGFNGGLVEVSDESCTRCHRDAGRPFKDYYANIIAYGELWGEDEAFTWHPFEANMFLRGDGDVTNFNHDNRRMRQDFVDAGLVAPFNEAQHPSSHYTRIKREWHDYRY